MPTANTEAIYKLSPVQEGILFHTLYSPESGVYVVQCTGSFQGDLNVAAFKQAWKRVLDRHAVLRTAFVWEELDEPVQVVQIEVELPFEQKDWRELASEECKERLQAFIRDDRHRDFDLSSAPLLRLTLIETGEESYEFICTFHHLLLDGWSVAIVLKEAFAIYEALCGGEDVRLESPHPYRDYIGWLNQQNLDDAESFWRQTLEGFKATAFLSFERRSNSFAERQDGSVDESIRLSVKVTEALQSFATTHQLTLNTLMQGAWALLLNRYSHEENVGFGAVLSGRSIDLPGIESMVGLFINTLPIRAQVSPEERLLPWLERLQKQQIDLLQYEYSPLVRVQGWSEVPHGAPMFDSILAFENYPEDESFKKRAKDVRVENFRGYEQTNYPLTVVVVPAPQLLIKILYSSDRFDVGTIRQMLSQLSTLLEGMITDPYQQLADVPILTRYERSLLLEQWSGSTTPYPRSSSIADLFEAQAVKTPDAIALLLDTEQLSYAELNRRANQLANYLQALGVGPEVQVGICAQRSFEMIIGILGILKAGAAYVPLDPSYPQERLAVMLDDSRSPVILTQSEVARDLPEGERRVISLDAEWPHIAKASAENPLVRGGADNLAYVIYTSGTTGGPKGVGVTNRAVVRLVRETNYVKLDSENVFLQLAPLAFDASTFEIWGSLLNGGRLVIYPAGAIALAELGEAIDRGRVNTLWLTAGLFHLMVYERLDDLRPLRHLLSGGDVLSPKHVKKVLKRIAGCTLINGYGPTESTTFACCCVMTNPSDVGETVPIGLPISNTFVYILDDRSQPVPVRTMGELYIAGDGLARGYLNDPKLTAAKFLPNPYGKDPGSRFYRTGDLARYSADGRIDFIGRIDHQVKVRGFRIELEEIEVILQEHPGVQEAVVVISEDKYSDNRLTAHVVLNPQQQVNTKELGQYLKTRLPGYMVPANFVVRDVIPLTPNGKVDRRALADTPEAGEEAELIYVAPRTPTEQAVAGIWSDVLGVERVGIHDNFFELGGHSLLATRIISRTRETFKVDLPVNTFLFKLFFSDDPNVERMAIEIDEYVIGQAIKEDLAAELIELDKLSDEDVDCLLGGEADGFGS